MQAQLEGAGKELREKEKALQQERVRIEILFEISIVDVLLKLELDGL